jgi:hypothetical protein
MFRGPDHIAMRLGSAMSRTEYYANPMAGYSGAPLVRKLGIKPGHRVRLVNTPSGYERLLGKLPDDVTLLKSARSDVDFIQVFSTRQSDLRKRVASLKKAMARDGMLWVSWPKGVSSIETDLSGDHVRRIGLDAGLVDVKVCAVDDDWSGLKFVYRLEDR